MNLYNNQLSSLPPQIGELKNLMGLYLQGNQLSSLPPQIGELKNLTELDLSGNDSLDIASLCRAFAGFPKSIILSTDEYASNDEANILLIKISKQDRLPPEIGELKNLTELDLSDNELSSLPPQIGELINLASLDLRGNPITHIPPGVATQFSAPNILAAFAAVLTVNAKEKNDYSSRVPLYQNALIFLERQMQLDDDAELRERVFSEYNGLAYFQLFQPDGKGAEQSCRRSLELNPENNYPHTNLPPALLLQGKIEEAKTYYLEWADKPFAGYMATYRDAFLDDLNAFEEAGVKGIDVDMVRGWLKK